MMIYTIGHSNHPIGHFIGLLTRYGITDLYDVRSKPFSRFSPQFNRERLQAALREAGIGYTWMGDSLGGRPDDPCCYINGKISYDLQAKTPVFQAGLNSLRADSECKVIAVMCAEKDPQNCHRQNSIARNLPDMDVRHILANGDIREQMEKPAMLF